MYLESKTIWVGTKLKYNGFTWYLTKVSPQAKNSSPLSHSIIQQCIQCRLNAWARWAVPRGPQEHRGPMLIYVCCLQHVF
jgi:hypothetical protein